jgi:hypothetical protein
MYVEECVNKLLELCKKVYNAYLELPYDSQKTITSKIKGKMIGLGEFITSAICRYGLRYDEKVLEASVEYLVYYIIYDYMFYKSIFREEPIESIRAKCEAITNISDEIVRKAFKEVEEEIMKEILKMEVSK